MSVPDPAPAKSKTASDKATVRGFNGDHLANERTFLAWTRTSISVIGLGFVVAKFSVWLRQFAARLDPNAPPVPRGYSMPLGLALMALGIALMWIGVWRYRIVKRAIETGEIAAMERTAIAVSVVVSLIGIVLMLYMVATY